MKKLLLRILNKVGGWINIDSEAMLVAFEIEKLEKNGDFDGAIELYQKSKLKYSISKLAPLWRLEGEHYQRKQEYSKALDAFEEAISLIKENPTTLGICYPARIYCGAAICAVRLGKINTSKKYYNKLITFESGYKNNKNMLDRVDWLREELQKHAQLKPTEIAGIK